MRRLFCCVFLLLLCVPQICFSQMPINQQSLQGTWKGSSEENSMSLQFMGSACVFNFSGQKFSGMYRIFGNQIAMTFQNGKRVSFTASLEGNSLVLNGSIYLTRSAPEGGMPGPKAFFQQ